MLLKLGSRGEDVKFLQRGLYVNCFIVGDFDGIFGPKVLNAVKTFQSNFGLDVDGIVGDLTWSKLVYEVKAIQTNLNKKGFYVGVVDGLVGSLTYTKIVEFQKVNGLTTDGMVGPKTKAILFNDESSNGEDNKPQIDKDKKIFLDAGHGGKDPGAVGNGLKEKDIVLSMVLKLGKILSDAGFEISYSRKTDVFIGLNERSNMANNINVDLFVSIHNNASDNILAKGTECFTYYSAGTSTKELSASIAKSIATNLGIINRGHKEAGFAVLKNSEMPAILIETAFISNSSDAILLKDNQDDFVNAIAQQIIKYFD